MEFFSPCSSSFYAGERHWPIELSSMKSHCSKVPSSDHHATISMLEREPAKSENSFLVKVTTLPSKTRSVDLNWEWHPDAPGDSGRFKLVLTQQALNLSQKRHYCQRFGHIVVCPILIADNIHGLIAGEQKHDRLREILRISWRSDSR